MRIAVVGSYGVGMTMHVARMPAAGETVIGGRYNLGPGGRGSNQAVGAARLGAQVSLLTAVGDDPFGMYARRLWADEGIRHGHVVVGNAATMVGFVIAENGGENRTMVTPGVLEEITPEHVAAFSPELAAADLAIVSLDIPLGAALEALRVARRSGTVTVLKPAPAHALPPKAWGWIDILVPNIHEARALAGVEAGSAAATDPTRLVEGLRRQFGGAIVLTLGGDGAYIHDGDLRAHVPAVKPMKVIDATGAGDAFISALTVAYGRGESLDSAVRYAAAAAAWTVGMPEVIPALPRPADIEAVLAFDET